MSVLEAVLLGIIQGLTEFLPISSSGHLEIARALFDNQSIGEPPLAFTVILHFATALSISLVFRKEIVKIIKDLLKLKKNENSQLSLKILISMCPAVFIGLFFEKKLEVLFGGQLLLVGGMLIITSILLYLADRSKNNLKNISYLNALWIGLVQAIAILPGISRSGSTIAIAIILGINRKTAAKFSFLMVIPLIIGSVAKLILDKGLSLEGTSLSITAIICGFLSAFIIGCIACKWMIRLVQQSKWIYFSVYCFMVGTVIIVYKLAI